MKMFYAKERDLQTEPFDIVYWFATKCERDYFVESEDGRTELSGEEARELMVSYIQMGEKCRRSKAKIPVSNVADIYAKLTDIHNGSQDYGREKYEAGITA